MASASGQRERGPVPEQPAAEPGRVAVSRLSCASTRFSARVLTGLPTVDIIRTHSVVYQSDVFIRHQPRCSTERSGSSVLDMIGRTPLVRLHRFERETPGVELYAKAEWQNPGGSVKDRAAARMILDGEASGELTPGRTILDATSGNTGIAYAMVGAARGYKVKLCLPENASPERKLILRALGAELVLTNPLEGTDGAIREARRLYAEDPDRYFYPDQYNNDANWRAHYDTTGAGDHRADRAAG